MFKVDGAAKMGYEVDSANLHKRATMTARKLLLVHLFALTVLVTELRGQTSQSVSGDDIYRNFLGDWNGTILENAEKMPAAVKLHISEEKDGRRMRWDYVFGVPGESGYARETKWFEIKPLKNQIVTNWKGNSKVTFQASGLDAVIKNGYGRFTTTDQNLINRCTYIIEPTTFDYLWQVSDGRKYRVYSNFHFVRDTNLSKSTTLNK